MDLIIYLVYLHFFGRTAEVRYVVRCNSEGMEDEVKLYQQLVDFLEKYKQ